MGCFFFFGRRKRKLQRTDEAAGTRKIPVLKRILERKKRGAGGGGKEGKKGLLGRMGMGARRVIWRSSLWGKRVERGPGEVLRRTHG